VHLAGGETVARLAGLVAVLALSRRLGPVDFGLVTLGATLVLWFGMAVDSGTEQLNVRDVARRPDDFKEIVEPVLGLRLALSGVIAAMFLGAVLITSSGSTAGVLAPFALMLPVAALNLRWMVLGVRASLAVAVGNVAAQALFMTGVLLIVTHAAEAPEVPLLQAAGELLYAAVIFVWILPRYGLVRPRVDLSAWRKSMRSGYPLMLTQMAQLSMLGVGLLLIEIDLGGAQTGYYAAATKPIAFAFVAISLFRISFLASYSSASAQHPAAVFRSTARVALGLAVALAAAVSLTGGPLVSALFGHAYAPAATVLVIRVWSLPLVALAGMYGTALIAADQQYTLMRVTVLSALVNVALTLAAVPLLGIKGAAAVSLCSYALLLLLSVRAARLLGIAPPLRSVLGAGRPAGLPAIGASPSGSAAPIVGPQ
jgi:O-antigen/teichoic acid export membrane protein